MNEVKYNEEYFAKVIGYRLLMFRRENGLSQSEFAKKTGCHQRFISEWESGKKLIPLKHALKICLAFDVDLDLFDPRKDNLEEILKKRLVEEERLVNDEVNQNG